MVVKLQADVKAFKLTHETSPRSHANSSESESLSQGKCELEFTKLMKRFREEQRSMQSDNPRQEMCITRLQGDALALYVEVVRGRPSDDGLFYKPRSKSESSVSSSSDVYHAELKVETFSKRSSSSYSSNNGRSSFGGNP